MGRPVFWAVVTVVVVAYQVFWANTSPGQNLMSGMYLLLILLGLRQFPSSRGLWKPVPQGEPRLLPRGLACFGALLAVSLWALALWLYGEEGFWRFWGLSLFSLFLFARGCRNSAGRKRFSPL